MHKIFAACLFAAAVLLAGCHAKEQKFESLTIRWDRELPDVGLTNHSLIVWQGGKSTEKNVRSLDEAENALGQYGWELVNSDVENGIQTAHLKRSARDDGAKFNLLVAPPK